MGMFVTEGQDWQGLPFLYSRLSYLFDIGSFTEAVIHQFTRTSWPSSSKYPRISPCKGLELQKCTTCLVFLFFVFLHGSCKLMSLCLHSKNFTD